MENNYRHFGLIIFLLLLIFANLMVLDLKIFVPNAGLKISDIATISTSSAPTGTLPDQELFSCPLNCISLINQATISAIGAPKIGTETLITTSSTATKEYYIPLGSGNTNKSDWDNLTATETTLDLGSYGTIKEAYFIASLRNPTQNGMVEAQLYNVTDKHQVWGSHVIMNGPASQTITSSKIALDPGNKLYRVQLKSTINYLVYLDNAKIRIIAEQ